MASTDSLAKATRQKSALWELGFRPFFFFGCLAGIFSLFIWLQSWMGWHLVPHVHALWHAHEMIHGFAIAIIIGFLYTAAQNWTGVRGIHGPRLMVITAIWLAGRIVFLLAALNPSLVAAIDLLFLPVAAGFLAIYLTRENQRHNLIFLVLLSLLWFSNLGYHLDVIGVWPGSGRGWLYFGVHTIIVMILVVSGRIVPFFTEKAITGYQRRNSRPMELSLPLLATIFALGYLIFGISLLPAIIAGLISLLAIIQLTRWYDQRIWQFPILWILYIGYLWLIAGFILTALAYFAMASPSTAVHAFTVGTISTLILGIISRVSLGHTGRKMNASRWIVGAYGLIIGGAVTRVFGPLFQPVYYFQLMLLSGMLWALAFVTLMVVYIPILISPRIDGRLG